MKLTTLSLGIVAVLASTAADAGVTKIAATPPALILQAAKISAGSELLFVSGQTPAPLDPTKKMADLKSVDDLGDTKTQTVSVLGKIKAILAAQGYTMRDVVKMTVFVAADPKLGKMDFAGMNEGFKQFFNSADNPTTTARSALQVAALANPYFLVEIEAIAAK